MLILPLTLSFHFCLWTRSGVWIINGPYYWPQQVYHWTCTHTMSIFAVCVCAARWIFVPVFPRAPCLGKIQREVSELFWPVQMVYELMRSMWRGRCSLDTPREYWVFSVFLSLSLASADRIQTSSGPANAHGWKAAPVVWKWHEWNLMKT